ncbi:hypothetical protein EI94DRAFT_1709188 [Lactarius quietus]|nr:hypothetical protein EI94DRAFT_1709188 [Lactarius quietus]
MYCGAYSSAPTSCANPKKARGRGGQEGSRERQDGQDMSTRKNKREEGWKGRMHRRRVAERRVRRESRDGWTPVGLRLLRKRLSIWPPTFVRSRKHCSMACVEVVTQHPMASCGHADRRAGVRRMQRGGREKGGASMQDGVGQEDGRDEGVMGNAGGGPGERVGGKCTLASTGSCHSCINESAKGQEEVSKVWQRDKTGKGRHRECGRTKDRGQEEGTAGWWEREGR